MKLIDDFLNRITMYKLMLYGLGALAAVAVLFGLTGTLQLDGFGLLMSASILLLVCYGANYVLAKMYGATINVESSLITALILFCIFSPPKSVSQAAILALTGVIAMASKYVLAIRKRHIFNPAAIAAVAVGALGLTYASWWIANDVMLPFVLLLGVLIVRKIRRAYMFVAFFLIAAAAVVLTRLGDGYAFTTLVTDTVVTWPLLFLGTVMLTEPLTTPPTRKLQIVYALMVGLLVGLGSRLHIGSVYMTPELALVLGNVFAYSTLLKKRLSLRFTAEQEIGQDIYEFRFMPDSPFTYKPGQYADVTLPVAKPDVHGNRRTFTIASSPTEKEVLFGIKFSNPPSSFKAALGRLRPGSYLYGSQVAGDFTLPGDPKVKVVFIAGGIGITPFRSMLKYLIDTKETRDIILFHQIMEPTQMVYKNVLGEAEGIGLKLVYVLTKDKKDVPADWRGEVGFIAKEMLVRQVPDYTERTFYVSGPPAMVKNYTALLRSMGIQRSRIVIDYFSGY
ncbi:MAG TPA: hypothetical protein VJ836_01355 [Candidatus Saccharimonadales bacterium]|nr:hypothetical protein [Candidatus Saccharimonadales bacterium]